MPKRYLLLVTCLAGLTFCLSLFNGFVGDDEVMIVRNRFYASLDNLPLLVSDQYISDSRAYFLNSRPYNSSGAVSYRPVNSLSYFLDRAVWDLNPFGYHLHNWLLHLANTALVFLLAWVILRQGRIAAWSAALFGTHPLAAEAVCAISYRHDLQAGLFSLAAIIFYIQSRALGHRLFYAASIACYAAAVFSKESAVLLPAVLLAYEFLYERPADGAGGWRKSLTRMAGFGIVTVMYLFVYTCVFPNSALKDNPAPAADLFGYAGYVLLLIGRYLTMWLLPMTVRPLPGVYNPADDPAGMPTLLPAILLAGVAALLFLRRRDRDLIFFTILGLVFYLPASNIIPLANPMAHRFVYLPMAGLCVGLMLLIDQLRLPRISIDVRLYLRIGLIAAAMLTSVSVSAVWRNNLTLAHSWTKDFPGHAKGHAILGISYFRRGDCAKAEPSLRQALLLGDRDPRLFYILGRCAVPDDAQAAAYYLQALRLAPDYAAPYRGLGQIAVYRKRYETALKHFERSLTLEPSVAAYRFIHQCLQQLGRATQWDRWREQARRDLTETEFDSLPPNAGAAGPLSDGEGSLEGKLK